MTEEHGQGDAGAGMRRRAFIGAGLAGGLTIMNPVGARAAAPRTAAARQAAGAAPSGTPIGQLPIRADYPHLPAIPVDPAARSDTMAKLETRLAQTLQARQSLTNRYTIGGETRTGYELVFGAPSAKPGRPLEEPEQFAMGWTTVPDVASQGRRSLSDWASSLTDADAATHQFWPMIAEHGTGYDLILPEKVTAARARVLRRTFKGAWTRSVQRAAAGGRLYAIDMSRFEALEPQTVQGAPRFTPATVTLLTRHGRTGALLPVAIAVSGHGGRGRRVFVRGRATDGAWLYALQAAKTSITVFGVWLGHVYHWHVVTAAMQMAMLNTLPASHPVHQLLAPQSKYLIAFDDALLALWSDIAPPTSLSSSEEFLALADDYAAGRSYFDDDPKETLKRLGLRPADFSHEADWDRYPVVRRLLTVWDLVEAYATACVHATYRSDAAVAGDDALQAWIATASAPDGGNVRGLPAMRSRAALTRVLTSLLYRITIHGVSRMSSTSNPALTFVANFPHCLQRTDIPHPRARIGTRELLSYLPNTATIGGSLTFYFTFAFSTPYEPFIPLEGAGHDLFFPGGHGDPRNRALIELRRGLARFIEAYQPESPQLYQWPRNIET